MKDCTKQQYTSVCLELIEMETHVRKVWSDYDVDLLKELIQVVRFYRQFAQND